MVQPLRKPDELYPEGQDQTPLDQAPQDDSREPELVLVAQPQTEDFDWSSLGSAEAATKLIPEELARKYLSFPAQVIVGLLREAQSEGVTIVLVTHNPEVAACADRQIRLRDGDVDVDVESSEE